MARIYIIAIILYLTILQINIHGQIHAPKLNKLSILNQNLPSEIIETSGLICFNNNIWTINDSGGESCLYALNPLTFQIERIVYIDYASNVDWEELAQDKDFVYIGDFGDNAGVRSELLIYKVKKKDLLVNSNEHVSSEVIKFSYSDKRKPLTHLGLSAYDCEAMVATDDSIFIFTKNWVHQKCDIYGMPKNKGSYNLRRIKQLESEGLITGACILSRYNCIYLIGYADYTPFMICVDKNSYMINRRYEYPQFAGYQTEAICEFGKDSIIVSAEKTLVKPHTLFFTTFRNK